MPIAASPIGTGVSVEWHGDDFKRGVQRLLRGAMVVGGRAGVERARQEVNKDTLALHNSIEAIVPRRASGTLTYELQLGVFTDHPGTYAVGEGFTGNTREDDRPTEYAYWQELMQPYLQPGMLDAVDTITRRLHDGLAQRGLSAGDLYLTAAEDIEEQVFTSEFEQGSTGRGGGLTLGGFLNRPRTGSQR